jgi:tyrosyl-tRNA synthetase
MKLFQDLKYRGLVKDVSDPKLESALDQKLTLYCGFDPTADSLHIGSLLPLMTLRRFQLAGHKVIAVVGGATGLIGDPKATERALLDKETLQKNLAGISRDMSRFLDFGGSNPAKLVNNGDWFNGISAIDFLRDVGKHFTVNYMMSKESVRARLEDRDHGISYTEFSYMLIQAYDFYHLYQKEGCSLQIGGSDQWGNMTAGCELIRRASAGAIHSPAFAMTFPLVMKADGTKFGKTESGTIWLNAEKTSPYQLYQFFLQTADQDTMTYLKYFTFLKPDELSQLEIQIMTAPEKREAQKRLAQEFVTLVHGEEELKKALGATQALFSDNLKTLKRDAIQTAFKDAPSMKKSKGDLIAGISLIDLLVETGLCSSKGASRKDILSGGIYVNNERVEDIAKLVKETDLIDQSALVLRKGKKNYFLVLFE